MPCTRTYPTPSSPLNHHGPCFKVALKKLRDARNGPWTKVTDRELVEMETVFSRCKLNVTSSLVLSIISSFYFAIGLNPLHTKLIWHLLPQNCLFEAENCHGCVSKRQVIKALLFTIIVLDFFNYYW